MRLLLDTNAFLWLAHDTARLSVAARSAICDPDNELWLSAASAWEIAIKHRNGALPLPEEPALFVYHTRSDHAIGSLDVTEQVATSVALLPRLHRDPFDRMLVVQAIAHDMTLVTPDEVVQRYPVRWLW